MDEYKLNVVCLLKRKKKKTERIEEKKNDALNLFRNYIVCPEKLAVAFESRRNLIGNLSYFHNSICLQ